MPGNMLENTSIKIRIAAITMIKTVLLRLFINFKNPTLEILKGLILKEKVPYT